MLTVHEDYYEEELDFKLEKLLPEGLRIEKTKALKVGRPRLVGDIGLRGFRQLYSRAKAIISAERIDFIYVLIPSFYGALLARLLHDNTGVPYGIDYIDPWVHFFPGSEKKFSRHWFSTQLAKFLEPIAVKKAALITGVAEGYYKGVQDRNLHLFNHCVFGAMPYGGEHTDHEKLKNLHLSPYLFQSKPGVFQMVYAGAMLPKAFRPLEEIFKVLASFKKLPPIEFHFIGTGKTADDPTGHNIKPIAEKYNLWQKVVFEYPKRIPYLDVLIHLNAVDGVFILGSTEPHYTPSKTYQAVLSQKPIMAVLHKQSTAVNVLRKSGAGLVLDFDGENGLGDIAANFKELLVNYLEWAPLYDPAEINQQEFEAYSAKSITAHLAGLLDTVLQKNASPAKKPGTPVRPEPQTAG